MSESEPLQNVSNDEKEDSTAGKNKRKLSSDDAENSRSKKLKINDLLEFQQNLTDELKCAVCSEIYIDAVTLNCSHSFCKFCIRKWLRERSTCPICRQDILTQNNTLVLDKCVDKLMEYSPVEMRERRMKIVENRHKEEEILDNNNSTSNSTTNNEEFSNITNLIEITNIVLDYITDDSEESSDDFGQCIIT